MTTLPQLSRAFLPTFVVLALVIGHSTTLLAQEAQTRAPKAYVEILGNGLGFSMNYEHPLYGRVDLRVGGGGLMLKDWTYVMALAMVGWQFNSGRHAFRAAVGGGTIHFADMWFLEGNSETSGYATVSVAYRYQPKRRGFFLQIAFTPVMAERTVLPWGGLGVGYAF